MSLKGNELQPDQLYSLSNDETLLLCYKHFLGRFPDV